jgi:trehalose-phosphatase
MPAARRSRDSVLDEFFHALQQAPHGALMLDYDGTLAPFRIRPEKAIPYPGVRARLNRIIAAGHTRVVLISGRWIKDLIPLLGLKKTPEIWGSHGWERLRADGTYEVFQFQERALQGLAEADMWVESEGMEDRCEQKPGCLALHWRGHEKETIENIKSRTLKAWKPLARRTGLKVAPFDGGLELRVPGRHKGHAVKTILTEMGPGTAVSYLGDDATDEDAFKALRNKGLSVLVRAKSRPTAADVRLKPPQELLEFLSRWHQTRRGRQ